jgi:hypothetical protein
MSRHLDAAQIEELLSGLVHTAASSHLHGCASCQRAVELAAAAELKLCLAGAHLDSSQVAAAASPDSENWEEVSTIRQHPGTAQRTTSFGRRLGAAGGLGCCLLVSLWFNSAAAASRTAAGQDYAMAPCYRTQAWCN